MDHCTAKSHALSVVYIEDDLRLARLTAKYLETHGILVTLAGDGAEGVTTVTRERPDIVLLDLMRESTTPTAMPRFSAVMTANRRRSGAASGSPPGKARAPRATRVTAVLDELPRGVKPPNLTEHDEKLADRGKVA